MALLPHVPLHEFGVPEGGVVGVPVGVADGEPVGEPVGDGEGLPVGLGLGEPVAKVKAKVLQLPTFAAAFGILEGTFGATG